MKLIAWGLLVVALGAGGVNALKAEPSSAGTARSASRTTSLESTETRLAEVGQDFSLRPGERMALNQGCMIQCSAVNSYYKSFHGYRVTAELLNLDMTRKFFRKTTLDIPLG